MRVGAGELRRVEHLYYYAVAGVAVGLDDHRRIQACGETLPQDIQKLRLPDILPIDAYAPVLGHGYYNALAYFRAGGNRPGQFYFKALGHYERGGHHEDDKKNEHHIG